MKIGLGMTEVSSYDLTGFPKLWEIKIQVEELAYELQAKTHRKK